MTLNEARIEAKRLKQSGMTVDQIKDELCRQGYKNAKGRKPNKDTVTYLLYGTSKKREEPILPVRYERVDSQAPLPLPPPNKELAMIILATPDMVRQILQGVMR